MKISRFNKSAVVPLLLGLAIVLVPSLVFARTEQTVWNYIQETQGVQTVWKVALSFVDFIVVAGLIAVAFANIFRIKIETYRLKQILPGLIIGIILANLSFFIMRLFIESTAIATQSMANLVAPYVDSAINGGKAGSYLMSRASVELRYSLFTLPGVMVSGVIAGVAGGIAAAAVFGLELLTSVAIGGLAIPLFLIILLLIAILLPLVLALILAFLLFLRNYILIVLFMVSPLAFFCLGFPPLKMLWQKWWGTFWKWLLMTPASLGVVALMVIFLHSMNSNLTPGAQRRWIDYLFVNGVAIALLFLANRIPFMWGSFFGFNAMKEWGKLGSNLATQTHKGAKAVTDAGINLAVRGANPIGISPQELNRRQGNARAKWNLLRAPESAVAGFKEYLSIQKGNEEKAIKRNELYGMAGGPLVRRKSALDRFKSEAQEVDDAHEVGQKFRELATRWTDAGGTAAELRQRLSKGDTGLMTDLNIDPTMRAMMGAGFRDVEIIEGLRYGSRLLKLLGGSARVTGAGTAIQGMIDDPTTLPFGGAMTGGATGESSGGSPSATSGSSSQPSSVASGGTIPTPPFDPALGARTTQDQELRQMLDESGHEALAHHAREIIETMPHTAITAAQKAHEASEHELQQELERQGLHGTQARSFIAGVFARFQRGVNELSPEELKTLAGGKEINHQILRPLLDGYRDRSHDLTHVLRESAGYTTPAAAEIPLEGRVATHIATQLKLEPAAARHQLDQELEKLRTATSSSELLTVHKSVANLAADVRPVDPGANADEIRQRIQENSHRVEQALETLEKNPQIVQARTEGDPVTLQQAMETVTTQRQLLHHTVVETAQDIDVALPDAAAAQAGQLTDNPELVARVAERIHRAAIDHSPTIKQRYAVAGDAERQQTDAVVDQVARSLIENLQGAKKGGQTAHGYVNDKSEEPKVGLRKWLETALEEGFASVAEHVSPVAASPEVKENNGTSPA